MFIIRFVIRVASGVLKVIGILTIGLMIMLQQEKGFELSLDDLNLSAENFMAHAASANENYVKPTIRHVCEGILSEEDS